ncbi:MAG: hypothetical protein BWZ10_01422 [candidate division BRC1 bacterium ADurb.BinA364]|nr:MAG: hypothetical protein BWZ10_01422 [candidate division BRC1 bacterium ADurb.BinA364]
MRGREMLINLVLVAGILALGFLIATLEDRDPEWFAPAGAETTQSQETAAEAETEFAAGAPPGEAPMRAETAFVPESARFVNLENRNPFDTIIPKPTPTPAPVQTPLPPPPLEDVIANWTIQMMLGDTVFVIMPDNPDEAVEFKVGGEKRSIQFNTWPFEVWVTRVDDTLFECDFMCNHHSAPVTKKMF